MGVGLQRLVVCWTPESAAIVRSTVSTLANGSSPVVSSEGSGFNSQMQRQGWLVRVATGRRNLPLTMLKLWVSR